MKIYEYIKPELFVSEMKLSLEESIFTVADENGNVLLKRKIHMKYGDSADELRKITRRLKSEAMQKQDLSNYTEVPGISSEGVCMTVSEIDAENAEALICIYRDGEQVGNDIRYLRNLSGRAGNIDNILDCVLQDARRGIGGVDV